MIRNFGNYRIVLPLLVSYSSLLLLLVLLDRSQVVVIFRFAVLLSESLVSSLLSCIGD
jgi:hypothetical protein